ncbi:MAG: hypothetical protein KDB00_05990 [Planctomycetales bacterium]|nr:hypothetical protein [Planctomycetales bacterium]
MKLISQRLHTKLVEAAEYTRSKNPDAMLTKTVPVNAAVAKEIGIELTPAVAKALDAAGPNTSVVQQVKLSEYIEKLAAYEPDPDPAPVSKPAAKRTPKK